MSRPDFLVVGHITKDVLPDGYTVGGTVTYAAATAHHLGLQAAIVTSAEPQLDLRGALDGIAIHTLPSTTTTTFENIYRDGHRTQYLRAAAGYLDCQATPDHWRSADIVLLGPLTQEVDPATVDCFPDALIGVTPQGWMRAWGADGRVTFTPWASARRILKRADVLVFSEEDVRHDETVIRDFAALARLMVVTRGRRGADLFHQGQVRHFPAFRSREVDPTGAGDVFAAAFLIRLRETGDPNIAVPFANATAAFAIEAPGVSGLPSREQVEARLAAGQVIE